MVSNYHIEQCRLSVISIIAESSVVYSWSRYIKTHILGSSGDPVFLGAHNFQHEQNHDSPKKTMGMREGVLKENTKMLPKYLWGE